MLLKNNASSCKCISPRILIRKLKTYSPCYVRWHLFNNSRFCLLASFSFTSRCVLMRWNRRRLQGQNLSTAWNFQILISDKGNPPLSSTTRVVVGVDDVNDNAPEFEQSFYKVQIPATGDYDRPKFQVSHTYLCIVENFVCSLFTTKNLWYIALQQATPKQNLFVYLIEKR